MTPGPLDNVEYARWLIRVEATRRSVVQKIADAVTTLTIAESVADVEPIRLALAGLVNALDEASVAVEARMGDGFLKAVDDERQRMEERGR